MYGHQQSYGGGGGGGYGGYGGYGKDGGYGKGGGGYGGGGGGFAGRPFSMQGAPSGGKGCDKGWGKSSFGKGKGTGGTFDEEDRSRDWYCPNCRERNFVKRTECFKCGTPKPKDAALCAPPAIPPSGTTLNGMVKSYNRKGFGFLMVMGADFGQDIYYTREALSPKLQTRDIPGQHVTFELLKFHDGKLSAVNIRPLGEEKEDPVLARQRMMAGKGGGGHHHGGGDDEDRSRDWVCSCGERNFVKRFECFKCGKPRPAGDGFDAGPSANDPPERPQTRGLSPHAGSRAMRDALAARLAGGASKSRPGDSRSRSRRSSRSRRKKKGDKKRKESSGSSSGSEESSESRSAKKKKKKKKKTKKKRSRSSSSSSAKSGKSDASSSKSSDCKMEEPTAASSSAGARPQAGSGANPEVETAKGEALQELMKLRSLEPKEARMSEWRALLRKWHPDKNPDRTEVATAVFQFLQKGKAILDEK